MESIEQITSKTVEIQLPDENGNIITVEKQFWNPTIANLTLMALGSSAPEIILSLADTLANLGSIPSELGPQTIVGSAAFNLLIISGVSILAVDDGFKKVSMVGVFLSTALFSMWAYVWFFLVLVIISPGYVELWEALVTLGFMGALVIIAYTLDKIHESKQNEAEKQAQLKKNVARTALRIYVKKFGLKIIIEVGQCGPKERQNLNPDLQVRDIENIK